MRHCDPDILALAGLGEELPAEDAAHLATCEQCTADAAELVELVTLAREAPPTLPPVPEAVWAGVRHELRLGRDSSADVPSRPQQAPPPETGEDAQVIPMQPRETRRRRGRGSLTIAAVAAAAGALVGGTLVWTALDRGTGPTSDVVIAQAVLDPLSPAVGSAGKAQVLETADGLVVRVDARGLPPSTGFHEVWLLDADATKLVSLGALPSGSVGTFTVPPGVDLTDFPVVDISLEPYDGDPGHSHDSLMRGTLEA